METRLIGTDRPNNFIKLTILIICDLLMEMNIYNTLD